MTQLATGNPDNHTTIILGAEGEMGRAMAREIACKGSGLLLVSTSRTDLQRFAICLQLKEEVPVDARKLNLSDREEVLRFVEFVRSTYEVRALINNTLSDWSAPIGRQVVEATREEFQNRFQGVALIILSLLPHLSGHSASFIQHIVPFPFRKEHFSAEMQYAAGKMIAFARELEEELRPTTVSVSILHPEPIRNLLPRQDEEGFLAKPGRPVAPAAVAMKGVRGMLRGDRLIIPGFWNRITFFLRRHAFAWLRTTEPSLGSSLQPSV